MGAIPDERRGAVPLGGVRRLALRGCLSVALLGAVCVAVIIGFLSVERRTTLRLPAPTGPYPVGRTILYWRGALPDAPARASGGMRELMAWIWYPAATPPRPGGGGSGDYLPADLRASGGGGGVLALLTHDAAHVRDPAVEDAALATEARALPVVLLRAGGSLPMMNYSTLAEDLASHGYVVVGFDAPYRTWEVVLPDGRVARRTPENDPEMCGAGAPGEECLDRIMDAWIADMRLALAELTILDRADPAGRFTGRLDLARLGVAGHSLGGAVAARFCHEDSRCRAGADIDGALHGRVIGGGLRQPFLFLLSDHGPATDSVSRRIAGEIQSVYDRLPPASRARVALRGTNHFAFSDDGALLKSSLFRGLLRLVGAVGIEGRRQLEVTRYVLRTFFDAWLKADGPAPTFDQSAYPELLTDSLPRGPSGF